jgi:phospholipid transport system substrate-binding protein
MSPSCLALPLARPGQPYPRPSSDYAIAAFSADIAATYADRFDSYSGQRLEVVGRQVSGSGFLVKTRIVKSTGEPVSVDYVMGQNAGAWRVSDVYLDGTISQLATQRS